MNRTECIRLIMENDFMSAFDHVNSIKDFMLCFEEAMKMKDLKPNGFNPKKESAFAGMFILLGKGCLEFASTLPYTMRIIRETGLGNLQFSIYKIIDLNLFNVRVSKETVYEGMREVFDAGAIKKPDVLNRDFPCIAFSGSGVFCARQSLDPVGIELRNLYDNSKHYTDFAFFINNYEY